MHDASSGLGLISLDLAGVMCMYSCDSHVQGVQPLYRL